MTATVETFRTSDGQTLYLRRFTPTGKPWVRLTVLHGIRSHGQWYAGSATRFAEAGVEVTLLDRRGSGLNATHRGDTPNFRRLIDDVGEFLTQERSRRSWLAHAVAGISWGAKTVLALPYRTPGLADGLILMGPGFCPSVAPPFVTRVRIAVSRYVRPTRRFAIPLNDPEFFTDSPEWQAFLRENRHDLHEATARFFVNSVFFDVYLRRARRRVRVPVVTLLSGRDRVVDNAKTRAFLTGLASADNRFLDYPGAAHTLEFERSQAWVTDVVRWLRARLY